MSTQVRQRFAFTVGANLMRSALSFATGLLLARWLGPDDYGRMAFLLGTFLAIRQLLDMGSATAFFTFMSQQLRSRRFFNSFCGWLALQFVVPALVIAMLMPAGWLTSIWHGEARLLVLLAFAAAFLQNSVWPVFQQAAESQRRTLQAQSAAVVVMATHLVAVCVMWRLGSLNLPLLFLAIMVEYLIATLYVRRRLEFREVVDPAEPRLASFLRYCRPLVPYAWVGFAYEFADRWLLQLFGGSVEQGYYAVSAQLAAISLIATTSILNIFWKEIAEAHHRGDHARAASLYLRVSRALFLLGAAFAGFLLPWAAELLGWLLGAAYVAGATTLAVMFFYPIHQSVGQIGSTMLYATEKVSLQVRVGIVFMLLSIVATYFVLAPADAGVPGLGLASTGLALKMVCVQFFQANTVAFIVARQWGWRFDWLHQPVSILGCVVLGWLAHAAVMQLIPGWPIAARLATAGALYAGTIGSWIYAMPWLLGVARTELRISQLWPKH